MAKPQKLATSGTQDTEKHNTICVTHHYAQTNTNNVNKTWDLLQTTGLEVKMNRPSFLCGNGNGHHNTEPTQNVKTQLHLSFVQTFKEKISYCLFMFCSHELPKNLACWRISGNDFWSSIHFHFFYLYLKREVSIKVWTRN
jgi:hypothetical protein